MTQSCQVKISSILRAFYCVKSVQIRNFFWSMFSRIQSECGPEKTPSLETFHAVFKNCMAGVIETMEKYLHVEIDGSVS